KSRIRSGLIAASLRAKPRPAGRDGWAPRHRALPIIGKEQFQEDFFATRRNRRFLLARYKGEVIAGIELRFFPGGLRAKGGQRTFLTLYLASAASDCITGQTILLAGGMSLYGDFAEIEAAPVISPRAVS